MRRPKIALVIGLQLTGVGNKQSQLPLLARGSYLVLPPNCSLPASVAALFPQAAWKPLALPTSSTAEHT